MNDIHDETTSSAASSSEEMMSVLFQRAGRRPPVPDELAAEVKAAARAQWQWTVRAEKRRRRGFVAGGLLAAAAALLVIVDPGGMLRGRVAGGPVASLEFASGALFSLTEDAALRIGDAVGAGSLVETRSTAGEPGRAALRLASGVSLRLDVDTRARLLSPSEIDLERGALYVDTGAEGAGPAGTLVAIRTPLGTVRDIGTRFEVRLGERNEGLEVRVRDGEVELEHQGQAHAAGAGTELALDASGVVTRRQIERHGALWQWTHSVLPAFDTEGKSLHDFLQWAAREGGWQLRFSDPGLVEQCSRLTLHGSIGGLDLHQALELTLLGSGLDLHGEVEEEALLVSSAVN